MTNIPLFHETQSELFLTLINLVNRISEGQRLSRADIIQHFPHIDWVNMEKINQLIDSIFIFNQQGFAELLLNGPIKNLTTDAHLAWLKSMLLDPECDFIISNELRVKLLKNLIHTESLINSNSISIIKEQGDKLLQIENATKLSIIWQALCEHKMLSYKYLDRAGSIHKGVAAPCRLEYDFAQHRIRLILWLQAENRAVKLNVNRLQQISLSNLTYGHEVEASFNQFLSNSKTSVTIQLLPKYNAVDRCFSIFSSYDKQAIYDEDNDSYTLIITYYHFDEEEIIDYILSLGAAVVVTEPLHLRNKIIQRLQQQLELCCSEQ